MALYAIGDLHLSLTANKSMEGFGPAWEHYVDRIGESLSQLSAQDVLVLAGDTSWGIDLAEAEADFRFLENCHGWVYDLVYQPRETALLAAAQDRGLPVIGGLALLHAQAELAFELFVGE